MRTQLYLTGIATYGIFLATWPLTSPYLWPVALLIVAFTFPITGARPQDYNPLYLSHAPFHIKLVWSWMAVFAVNQVRVYIESAEVLEEVNIMEVADRFRINLAIKNVALLVAVLNLLIFNRRQSLYERMVTLAGAMALYGLAALAFDVAFPDKARAEFGSSRFEGKEGRWNPALSRSNEHLSWMQSLSLSCILGLCAHLITSKVRRVGQIMPVICLLLLAPFPLLCMIRTEFRGHLTAVMGAFGFVACWKLHVPRLGLLSLATAVFILPCTFFTDVGPAIMDAIQIDALMEKAGSNSKRSTTLTGRTDLWYYAGQELSNSKSIMLLGAGPALRDASPADSHDSVAIPGYRMNFHSAAVELFMANGVPMALLLMGMVLAAIGNLKGNHGTQGGADDGIVMALCWFAGAISNSVTSPGIAVFEMSLLGIMPLFAALAWLEHRPCPIARPHAGLVVADGTTTMASQTA